MNWEALFREVGNVLIWWAAIVGTLSVIVHLRVYDSSSPMSRHLLIYMAAIGAVFDLTVTRLVFGDSWAFQVVRLVVFFAVPLAMTQRLLLQIKAQRDERGRADRREDVNGDT